MSNINEVRFLVSAKCRVKAAEMGKLENIFIRCMSCRSMGASYSGKIWVQPLSWIKDCADSQMDGVLFESHFSVIDFSSIWHAVSGRYQLRGSVVPGKALWVVHTTRKLFLVGA